MGASASSPSKTRFARLLPAVVGLGLLLVWVAVSIRTVPADAVGLFRSPVRSGGVRPPGPHLVLRGVEHLELIDPYRRSGAWTYTTPDGSRVDLELAFDLRLSPDRAAALLAGETEGAVESRARLDRAIERVVESALRETAGRSLPTFDADTVARVTKSLGRLGSLEGPVRLGYLEGSPLTAALRADEARERIRALRQETDVRILLVGLDGFDWQIAEPLIERGWMPNLAALRERGAWGHLRALMPMLSPLLWTSMATGVTPDRHGIVDFLVTDPATGARLPVTSRARRVHAVWDLFGEAGRTVDCVAWWATWPAERINGHLVSDRVSYSLFDVDSPAATSGLTWPEDYYGEIRDRLIDAGAIDHADLSRFVDVDAETLEAARARAVSEPETGWRDPLNHLTRILAAARNYHRIALGLLDGEQADLTMVYYQLVDEISHRFMHFAPPRLPGIHEEDVRRFGQAVERAYRYQDRLLGELLAAADPATTVIVVSDHGFLSGPDRPRGETADVEDKPGRWHRRYGIFVAAGPPIERTRLDSVSPLDIAPTLLYLAGLPVAQDMDGRVVEEAIRPEFRASHPRTTIATYEVLPRATELASASGATAVDAEMMEHLRSLGYIGATEGGDAPAAGDGDRAAIGTHVNLAATLIVAGELERAESEIREALRIDPDYLPALLQLFNVRYRQRRFDEAIELARRLVREDELPRGRFALRLARSWSGAGRTEEGIREMRRLDRPELGGTLALLLLDSGDRAGADRVARATLERDPLDEVAMDVAFDVARRDGRLQEIAPLIDRALERNPRSVAHLNYRAYVTESAGDLEGAERLLRRALEAEPDNAASRSNLGRVLLRRGRPAEAVEQLRRAAELSPSDASIRATLAEALRVLDAGVGDGG